MVRGQDMTEQISTSFNKLINQIKHNKIKSIEPYPWNTLYNIKTNTNLFEHVYFEHIKNIT